MRSEWGFLIACDMPTPQEAVIRLMWSRTPPHADASVAYFEGRPTAFHAFYRKSCLPSIDRMISEGERTKRGGPKMSSFYNDVDLNIVEEQTLAMLPGYLKSFANYNTQIELQKVMNDV